MSKSKKAVSRSAKSTTQIIRIHLSQINLDKKHDYCHRSGDALKADQLAPLADNLVSEGQNTPMTVYDSGQKDKAGRTIYILIGGFRRYHSLKLAIKKDLDTILINVEMKLDAVEVVQGVDQTDEEFRRDLLVRSVAENEQRRQFTTNEKLEIVKQFKTDKTPDPRAASALSISETQYRRFVSVVEEPWLHDYVTNNCVGMTDAAELTQLASKKDRVDDFKKLLDAWVKKHQAMIEAEKQELAKVKKKLSGSAAQVKKYATKKLVKHWLDCLENGKKFDDNVGFLFGIRIDPVKGTITIPQAELKLTDLTAADLEAVIGELQGKADECIPLLRRQRMLEASTEMKPEEIEKERKRIQELRQQEKQKRAEAEAGQSAEDFDEAEKKRLRDIAEGIDSEDDENTDDEDVNQDTDEGMDDEDLDDEDADEDMDDEVVDDEVVDDEDADENTDENGSDED